MKMKSLTHYQNVLHALVLSVRQIVTSLLKQFLLAKVELVLCIIGIFVYFEMFWNGLVCAAIGLVFV